MHFIGLFEGYADETGFQTFVKEWHGKTYANGKAKLRVREVKLIDLGINECGRDEFLADFKTFCRNKEKDQSGSDLVGFKWKKLTKWLRKVGWLFGVKYVDFDKIPATPTTRFNELKHFNGHLLIIGEVKDNRADGIEQV